MTQPSTSLDWRSMEEDMGPPCCPHRQQALGDSTSTPPSRQSSALRHQHKPYIHRIGSSQIRGKQEWEMASILSRPFLAPPASFSCLPASPSSVLQVLRDLGLEHWPSQLLSTSPPISLLWVSLPSCSKDWGIPVEHLRSKALRMCSVLCLLPLPLPGSSLLPPNQAVGSSSGSWGSPPPPPPSRALRFFDISAQGLGFGGFLFPSPWPSPLGEESEGGVR